MNQGGALIQVYRDGSILLSHGGTEMGQGLFTKTIQVYHKTHNDLNLAEHIICLVLRILKQYKTHYVNHT